MERIFLNDILGLSSTSDNATSSDSGDQRLIYSTEEETAVSSKKEAKVGCG